MTLDEAKDALRNGALFSDVRATIITTWYNEECTTQAIEGAITELRRFFCYDLPLQERWKGWQPPVPLVPPAAPSTPPKLSRQSAKEQGYEGSPCTVCGGMRVKRNGACLLCEECQTSSGCS